MCSECAKYEGWSQFTRSTMMRKIQIKTLSRFDFIDFSSKININYTRGGKERKS